MKQILLKRKVGILTACVLSALMNTAFAATQNQETDKYEMDEYVVTATKTELNQKENPRSVEVITKEEIQELGASSVRDALRAATSLNIVSLGGTTGDTISIRGGDDVLVMINGKRYASEGQYAFLNQNAFTLDRININSVERIEILRGPDAAIYGSGAQAGIINIITKKSEKESFTMGFTTGTREMSNYYHWDSGLTGKVNAVFDANFSKLRNIDSKTNGENLLYGPKQNYNLDVDYIMDDHNSLNLLLNYNKENYQWYNTSSLYGYQQTGVRPFNSERKTAVLTYNGKNNNSDYSLSTSYSKMTRETSLVDTPGIGEREYQSWNVEARDAISTSDNNKLIIGGEYRNDKSTVFGSDDQKDINQYSVYVHDEYLVNNKLVVIPSVRYDYHESFGGETSPNLGITYNFNDSSRFKLSYGEGYRAPSIEEMFGEFDHGGMFQMMGIRIYGNPDLKPETTRGYELSYEQEFGDRTAAKVTYFNNRKHNAIEMSDYTVWSSSKKGYTWVNIDEASYEGTEFEIKHDLGNGLSLIGNYEYLDAYNEDDNTRLAYSARNTWTAKLSWTEPVKKEWNVTAWNTWYTDFRYAGSMGANPTNYSFNTFNIVVNKKWQDKYRAFVGIDNLFDKEIGDLGYYGRMWRCGFEMTF